VATFKKGAWYFVVKCRCGRINVVGTAPSPAESPAVSPYPRQVNCECGVSEVYQSNQIERIQKG
jgi:hypothetical protein